MAVPELISAALQAKACGSIVAPAGYGKTETIADIVVASTGRCLLLTHTLAGIDALKKRLTAKKVKTDRYQLDTIAAWSLRLALSFPVTSGLNGITTPRTPRGSDWPMVYAATIKLLKSRTMDAMIGASYDLVLVDEYQDCGLDQHEIVAAISRLVQTIVFGDPMQSIFEIGGQRVVKWTDDVLPSFPAIDRLSIPWRWRNQNNNDLATWLGKVRQDLEGGGSLNLTDTPACVRVHHLKTPSMAPTLEKKACYFKALSPSNRLVIIGSKASEDSRAALARRVHAQTVETIECKRLRDICLKIEGSSGLARLQHLIEFLHKCSVGVKPRTFLRRVEEIYTGKKKPRALKPRESAALGVITQNGLDVIVSLLDEFRQVGQIYRRELLYALRDSLLTRLASEGMSLTECAWHVQERRRHAGRRHGFKIVASTLLVKGLEYENAVVFLSHRMTKEDVYVALTRASLRIEIVTESFAFQPA